MRTATRDIERLEEQDTEIKPHAFLILWGSGALALAAIAFAAYAALDNSPPVARKPSELPMAAPVEQARVDVDATSLVFPNVLGKGTRSEVAAAMEAAGAELRHLDPVGETATTTEIAAALPGIQTNQAAGATPGYDGRLTLQVISYTERRQADRYAAALRQRGHRAYVSEVQSPDRETQYRVRIGPFETLPEARRYRTQFESDEGISAYVVRKK